MGEELNKPEKNYSPIDKENIYLKFGFNQVQGWKKSMEDYAIEFLDSGEKKFMNIFGIIKWNLRDRIYPKCGLMVMEEKKFRDICKHIF